MATTQTELLAFVGGELALRASERRPLLDSN
jgi:hypothetical protein